MLIKKNKHLKNSPDFKGNGPAGKTIEDWRRLISGSPNDGNIYNTIGDLYLKQNDLKNAIEAYLQAAEAFYNAGFTLKTIAVYKKVLKHDPRRYEIYLKLADINVERGFTANAIEQFLAVAKHYTQVGKAKDALEIYRKIGRLDPSNTNIRLKLAEMWLKHGAKEEGISEYLAVANVYADSGQTREAEALYEQVLKLDPSNEIARTALAPVMNNPAKPPVAPAFPKPATPPPHEPGKKDLLSRAEAALDDENYQEAEQLIRKLITSDPLNPLYQEKLGYLFLKKGQAFLAFPPMKTAIQRYLQKNEPKRATKLMKDYLRMDPDQIEAHQLLAAAYEQEGNLKQAISEYAHVIDEHLVLGDLEQAQLLFEKIKGLDSRHRDVRRLRLVFDTPSPKPAPAFEPQAPSVQEESPLVFSESQREGVSEDPVENLFTHAELYFKYGLITKAIEQLDQLLVMDPENSQAHIQLKEIYLLEGRKSRAVEECLRLAGIYKKRGDAEAYEKAMEEARNLDPDHPFIRQEDLATLIESGQLEAVLAQGSATRGETTLEASQDEVQEETVSPWPPGGLPQEPDPIALREEIEMAIPFQSGPTEVSPSPETISANETAIEEEATPDETQPAWPIPQPAPAASAASIEIPPAPQSTEEVLLELTDLMDQDEPAPAAKNHPPEVSLSPAAILPSVAPTQMEKTEQGHLASFIKNIAVTAGHFFGLSLLWFWMSRYLPENFSVLLWIYLVAGPLPYLAQAYLRQRKFDLLAQAMTYLMGHAVLLFTFGYVWQCRIQVVKISIPMVVNDPPWMTTLMFGYLATAGTLSYLMALMSGRNASKDPSNIYLAPPHITNPILRGVLRTASDPQGDQSK